MNTTLAITLLTQHKHLQPLLEKYHPHNNRSKDQLCLAIEESANFATHVEFAIINAKRQTKIILNCIYIQPGTHLTSVLRFVCASLDKRLTTQMQLQLQSFVCF